MPCLQKAGSIVGWDGCVRLQVWILAPVRLRKSRSAFSPNSLVNVAIVVSKALGNACRVRIMGEVNRSVEDACASLSVLAGNRRRVRLEVDLERRRTS